MLSALAIFEVMDKEPPLSIILLCTISIGAVGMLVARRRPILGGPFIAVVLVIAYSIFLELRDSFVGEAILREGGVTYILGCGFAVFFGIAMPLLGAFVGAKKIQYGHPALRWTSGGAGVLLLALTVFAGYGFLLTAYDNYVFFPKVKAADHYVMPLRWQDIVAEFSLACLLVALLVLSVYLLRPLSSPQKSQKP